MYEKIKLNVPLRGHAKGSIIRIKILDDGNEIIPADIYWRNRFFDAINDHCIEFVSNKKPDELKEIKKEIKKMDLNHKK